MISFLAGFLWGLAVGMITVGILDQKERETVRALKINLTSEISKPEVVEAIRRGMFRSARRQGRSAI